VPFERLTKLAWARPRRIRDPRREQRVVAQIVALGKWTGLVEGRCLQRSLLMYRELSKLGADPTLMIGFMHDTRGIQGHAWVVLDGLPVQEPEELLSSLTPVCAYGANGMRSVP
jgi:hypothetical protein